jgi:hypothetical protein
MQQTVLILLRTMFVCSVLVGGEFCRDAWTPSDPWPPSKA